LKGPLHTISWLSGLILLLFSACGSIGKDISEGQITYECKAVDDKNEMAAVAPSRMYLKFKKDRFAAEMSTLGVFVTTFVADPKAKTITQMVKVWEDKKACIEHDSDIAREQDDYKLSFKFTNDIKEIAGFKCKKVIATKVDDPTITFDVWYTEEIDVQSPNFSNPYAEIKGMLMEYRLKKFGLEMTFKAVSVSDEKIPDETFVLPAYYKIITVKEMQDFFESIQ
jgi:GLPGLI family protein